MKTLLKKASVIPRQYWILALIVFAGFAIRLFVLRFFPFIYFPPDTITYFTEADNIYKYGMIKADNVMPLYPLLIGLTKSVKGAIILNIIIDSVSIIFVYQISKLIFNRYTISLLASFIYAIYPYFICYSNLALTETSFQFLLLLSILLLYKKQYIWGAIIIIISILERPVLDMAGPLLIFIFCFYVHNQTFKYAIKKVITYVILYVIIMSPWWYHNYNKYSEFVRLNLGEGKVIYCGNVSLMSHLSKCNYSLIDCRLEFPCDFSIFNGIVNPIESNVAMKDASIVFIKHNLFNYFKSLPLKFLEFWRFVPNKAYSPYKILISIINFPIFVCFLLYLIFYAKKHIYKLLPLVFILMYFTLVHVALLPINRYRIPIDPYIIIFSSSFFIQFISGKKISKFTSIFN